MLMATVNEPVNSYLITLFHDYFFQVLTSQRIYIDTAETSALKWGNVPRSRVIRWYRLRVVSLFSVVRRAKRETRKGPRAWLMVGDVLRVHSPYLTGWKRETARSLAKILLHKVAKFYRRLYIVGHELAATIPTSVNFRWLCRLRAVSYFLQSRWGRTHERQAAKPRAASHEKRGRKPETEETSRPSPFLA